MSLRVNNLPAGATVADLWELFHPFGRVAWAAIRGIPLPKGDPPGVGYVDLATGGAAAICALDGSDYRGRRLAVREADLNDLEAG
ncbi:RNA-binding protein [Limnoglobus roseus]|uniref:RNA-binding protein n=1 Tax=Limnoglobus roseus TaxID=2598579 RepID=A0A5C1AMM8_9BACT|nr:hypothetical protein [Limnoglobus roseus]QEL20501.1 RNA-binding protein [Limnoglobus roseus]